MSRREKTTRLHSISHQEKIKKIVGKICLRLDTREANDMITREKEGRVKALIPFKAGKREGGVTTIIKALSNNEEGGDI